MRVELMSGFAGAVATVFLTKVIKMCFTTALIVGVACSAFGTEVTSTQAQTAACRWVLRGGAFDCAFRSSADEVRTYQENGAKFHIVRLSGGGFVVMSADTRLEPVLAFSSAADLPSGSPLLALLEKDVAARLASLAGGQKKMLLAKAAPSNEAQTPEERKWAELLAKPRLMATQGTTGMEIVSDIRVAPILKSRWSQKDYRNYGRKSEDDYCYNYYTPEHAPCGCVATAGAQIMRHFEWPKQAIGTTSYTCTYNGVSRTLQLSGTAYRWGDMPLEPAQGVTLAERQAIGRLTADIGIACGMDYSPYWGSAGLYMLARVMTVEFGYANAVAHYGDSINVSLVNKSVLSNLDAGLPVAIGVSGNGGHVVVGDGYGYSNETLYYHINLGWSGLHDAWYAPPNIEEFTVINEIVYNIYTSSDAGASICSGRVLDAAGAPIAGATVEAKQNGQRKKCVTTNAKGIYALILPPGQYEILATSGSTVASKSIDLGACVSVRACEPESGYYGRYWTEPIPEIGNLCGQDIRLTGVSGVMAPVISPSAQTFYPTVTVSIACETPDATIRYTLDGSDPTESSALYAGPFTLSDSAIVKAAAWKAGMNKSAITAVEYTIDPPMLEWYTDKAAAFAAATAQGKRVFMVCGRTSCPNTMNTRGLCENDPSIRKLIDEGYVPWFCNCDTQKSDWSSYAVGMGQITLPLCSIIDVAAPGSYLVRSMGPLAVADLKTMLGQYKPDSPVPSAPTGVSATDGSYADYVRVTWSAASGATSYNLYRSTTTSRPSTATKTGVTSPYNDTTATPGTKYYYWIAAVNSAGSSVSSYDTGYRAVSLTLGKSSDSYASTGGSGSASVTANTSWSASANVSWITLGTKSASGNGTLTYTVAANSTTASRTGTITVTAGSGTTYPATKTISVTQAASAPTTYTVIFNANGGRETMASETEGRGRVYNLPKCAFAAPQGKRFAGWACSNGRCYDDGMLVFDLAKPGETVTMTAIWE